MTRQKLSDLCPGDHAVIASIDHVGGHHIRKLLAFGMTPGAEVAVLQNYPAWVIQIDYAQIAFDTELAEHININKINKRK